MKKVFLSIGLLLGACVFAQFNIDISTEGNSPKEAYVYTLDGSKDILVSKELNNGKGWQLKYPKSYVGMMKVYFPELSTSFTFISENKDVAMKVAFLDKKIKEIQYLDSANQIMDELQNLQKKKGAILPVLQQMLGFYKPSSEFYKAIEKEIAVLSENKTNDVSNTPFVEYYNTNYNKFLSGQLANQEEIIHLMRDSDNMLETSSLMRPILTEYLKKSGNNIEQDVDKLLEAVDVESPRGQVVLSELIEIFDAYGIDQYKEKYLKLASNMKCTLNSRLSSVLEVNKNTAIGAIFTNYKFINPTNTKAKSLYDVKASKKVIVFWSSTCSHCERDVPQFIAKYNELKNKGIEIVGFSLDTDKQAYENRVKSFPWINDSELKGWYSSYGEKYNIHATPSYFILDADNKIIEKPTRIGEVFEKLGVK